MATKVKINKKLFTKEYFATPNGKNIGEKIVKEVVEDIVNEARVDFLVEFLNDPVTKEIEAGPNHSVGNQSGTLSGYGNLFSFIGFAHDANPIKVIKDYFLKKTGITKVRLQNAARGRFSIQFSFPTKEEIYADERTHIRWQPGRSWLDGIEHGMSGFGQYLLARNQKDRIASLKTGGSGEAIQLKGNIKLRPGSYKKRKYFSYYYNRFLARLTQKR